MAALQEAIDLRGRGLHADLAQALAILRSTRSLTLAVGHLPSEANTAADALSRQAGPTGEAKAWPFTAETAVSIDRPLKPQALRAWLRDA